MHHPILSNKKYLGYYVVFWFFVAVGHFLFDYQVFNAGIWLSVADGAISSLIYALIGSTLWFAVRFSQMDNLDRSTIIFNHLALAAMTILCWLSVVYYMVKSFPVIGVNFQPFFESSLFWRVLLGLWHYALIMLVYYLYQYYNNYKVKLEKEVEYKETLQQAELSVLRSQLNPHFLFNSLNSISSMTLNDPGKAREMISQLSDFLRFTIQTEKEELSTFEKELDIITNYLAIEKVRFGERLEVNEDSDEECLGKKLPNLILQPLVENAVKFGLNDNEDKTIINITAGYFHGMLKVQVENNYKPNEKTRKGMGVGLKNIAQRMQVTYGRNDLMQICDKDGNFRVTLNFPQRLNGN